MKAAALFVAFALSKAAALAGHPLPHSTWAPVACLWQDAAVALAFAIFERFAPKRWCTALFWILVAYAAGNIPVMRAVATPLTVPMLRAAGGPLADSFRLYTTWTNAGLIVAMLLITAAALRLRSTHARALIAAMIPLAALGPFAAARIDDSGLSRNAVIALVETALPHFTAHAASSLSRTSPFVNWPPDDLSDLRGVARGRNIVMVSLESTAAQYLRLYGGHDDVTPNLDRLAEHGIVFDNAYAVFPESIKELYSVLCSAYPPLGSEPESFANSPCRSPAQVLAEAGYRTAMFHSGRFGYLGMESVIHNRGYQVLEDAGDIGGNHRSSFGVDEPATVAAMLHWIDSLPQEQRFFLTYLPIAGHHPYNTAKPGPFDEREDFGRYRNALLDGDASLGALRDGLRARGLDGNTVWVIYGDHGEAFGQHEGNYAHTFYLYEENVHVPFLIAAPGAIGTAKRSRGILSLVDTAPTLLDLAGLAIPAGYRGESALVPQSRMALFYTDYSLTLVGIRDGPWKMLHQPGHRPRLFNLETDPGEQHDVAARHAAQAAWYQQAAGSWTH